MNQTSFPLEELIDKTYQQLKCMDYRPSTLRNYWKVWRTLLLWSRKQEIQSFTKDLATKFMEEYGIPLGESHKPLTVYRRRIRTSLRILEEFALYGCWQRRRLTKNKVPFPPAFKAVAEDFLKYRKIQDGISALTLYNNRRHLLLFTTFLESGNLQGWSNLSPGSIPKFFASQTHFQPITSSDYACTIRNFLKYLWLQRVHSKDLSLWVPHFRIQSDARIPSVWQQKDVEALLAAVERSSPLGKRNYAILILATYLGLRVGEIRTLKLENIHWEKAQLELSQPKTGNTLVLPLSEKVGRALIDYLRNGRPHVSYREIFVRHKAPLEPFANTDKFYTMITTYIRKAHIPLNSASHRGLHSLRHTLATRMLEQETPMETIAAILGHASVETTRIYTKVNIEALRNVALDPEEVCHE